MNGPLLVLSNSTDNKICTVCRQELPLSEFRRYSKSTRVRAACRPCENARNNQRRADILKASGLTQRISRVGPSPCSINCPHFNHCLATVDTCPAAIAYEERNVLRLSSRKPFKLQQQVAA